MSGAQRFAGKVAIVTGAGSGIGRVKRLLLCCAGGCRRGDGLVLFRSGPHGSDRGRQGRGRGAVGRDLGGVAGRRREGEQGR